MSLADVTRRAPNLRCRTATLGLAVPLVLAACGGGSEPVPLARPCPDFDSTVLTDLSFIDPDAAVVVGAWSSEADRFVGLCTDEVLVALRAAGIGFVVVGADGNGIEESTGTAGRSVQLLSGGHRIAGAVIS